MRQILRCGLIEGATCVLLGSSSLIVLEMINLVIQVSAVKGGHVEHRFVVYW